MQPANGTLAGSLANIANDPTGAPEPVAMSLAQQIVIWVIYAVMLLFFAFKPTVLGLGRPLVALLAAAVVVFVQDLTPGPSQNLTEDVDYDILMYLFGLMVISHYMNMTGITRVPNSVFKWTLKHYGPYGLIWALSFFTGLVAMFFTNDMAVFLLTPMVVRLTNAPKYAQQLKGSSFIFLMLISTNANIASAMSPIGNPQNVLVASISGVSFGTFFAYLSIATIICWTLNTATLCLWFWTLQRKHAQSLLKGGATESLLGSENKNAINSGYLEEDDDEEEQQHNGNGTSNASVDPLYVDGQREKPQVRLTAERHFTALPSSVLNIMTVASTLIFVAWILLVSMVEKITLGWATVLAALLVVLVHSVALAVTGHTRSADPEAEIFRNPEVVDYGLIFMFWANFVLIGALLDTGWPQYVFDALLGSVGDAMVELWLVLLFVLSVVFASNVLTNVPVVLLLAPLIDGLSGPHNITLGWLLIAFSTTVAGNLTLVGSACNLIVDARSRAIGGPELKFMAYFWFGFPTTLVFSMLGTIIIVVNYGWY